MPETSEDKALQIAEFYIRLYGRGGPSRRCFSSSGTGDGDTLVGGGGGGNLFYPTPPYRHL